MRIDDRKVNGRVLLDALDPVDGFNILVASTGLITVASNAIT